MCVGCGPCPSCPSVCVVWAPGPGEKTFHSNLVGVYYEMILALVDVLASVEAMDAHPAPLESLTGLVENGRLRVYISQFCGRNYTLPQLYPAFAAHAVEWNILGKHSPWNSVLSTFMHGTALGGKYSDVRKQRFYKSGVSHVERVMLDLHRAGLMTNPALDGALGATSVLDFGCGLGTPEDVHVHVRLRERTLSRHVMHRTLHVEERRHSSAAFSSTSAARGATRRLPRPRPHRRPRPRRRPRRRAARRGARRRDRARACRTRRVPRTGRRAAWRGARR